MIFNVFILKESCETPILTDFEVVRQKKNERSLEAANINVTKSRIKPNFNGFSETIINAGQEHPRLSKKKAAEKSFS